MVEVGERVSIDDWEDGNFEAAAPPIAQARLRGRVELAAGASFNLRVAGSNPAGGTAMAL